MDPTLTENSDVNVVFDNSEGTDFSSLLGLIVMGSFSPDISLKSITSKISNIHAIADNSTFIGGSLGGVSGDIRSEISNCTINDVVGGNLSSFPISNIGGSVYLTINSGSYGSVAGAYWDMDGSNNLKIGGSVNTTINGGRIANLFGGSLDGG